MELILIRYSEIGLKSTPVRKRFETQLRDNIMTMLACDGIEALVHSGDARFFAESDRIDETAASIRKVFGVASLSKAAVCGSGKDEICAAAAAYSVSKIRSGQTFAVRARREGTHAYSSMELARDAGSAIFFANEGLKVDLHYPDVTFYIEVRDNKAFLFHEYIPGPGGLPLGSQGKVIAEANDERGILSAWLMMKRGCRTLMYGSADMSLLERYDPNLKHISPDDDVNILGKVLGTSLHGLDDADVSCDIPVYFPTIGMSDQDVQRMIEEL